MNYKSISIQYKDEGNGSIEGYASTWVKEPDSYGDICRKGCFKNSLENRWDGGKNIPLLWAHKMDDLNAYVGIATAQEDEIGLFFHADFNDSPEAKKIRELYKSGTLNSFSFAYDTIDSGLVTLEDGRKANELRELDIFEISCVLVPANATAVVTEVKSGRRNRKSDEDAIKEIIRLATSLLDEVSDETPEETEEPKEEQKANEEADSKELDDLNARKDALLDFINKI